MSERLSASDLSAFAEFAGQTLSSTSIAEGDLWERGFVPPGEQDNALAALAGFMRAHPHWRLDEDGLHHALANICSNGIIPADPSRGPWTDTDFARIAGSIARHAVGEPSFEVVPPPAVILRGDDTPLAGPTVRWWVRGFVPRAELVMLFGPKASGKSTFGSWLAALVTARGSNFLHVGVEEPFRRFLQRAVLGGAERSRVLGWKDALVLPRDVDTLVEVVLREQIRVVYFDSVYSNFEPGTRMLESTRTRHCLEPLAKAAQEHGFTVIAQFHDRRADGDYMGSTEMINVARVILRLSRRQGEASRLHVRTTNFTHPEHALRLDAVDKVVVDPATGDVQLEEQDDGSDAPLVLKVVTSVEKVAEGADGVNSSDIATTKITSVDDVIDAC